MLVSMTKQSTRLLLVAVCGVNVMMFMWYAHARFLVDQRLTASGFPERNFSDLFPRWLGTRELLLHGRDPYSSEMTREIQKGYYGRPIDHTRAGEPMDEQRFAYPLYVAFLLAPTVNMPFTVARSIFIVLLVSAVVLSALLWIRTLGMNIGAEQVTICVLLTLATIPCQQCIQLQQLSLLVEFLLAGVAYCLIRGKFMLAGFLLAAATIKPQLCIWFIVLVLLWCAGLWTRRKAAAISFVAALAVLIATSDALLPKWPLEFVGGFAAYLGYTHVTNGLFELFGRVAGSFVLLGLLAAAAVAVRRAVAKAGDATQFAVASVFVLTFTCVAIPSLAPHNEILLLPAFLLLVKERSRIWAKGKLARSLWFAGWLLLAWPWTTGTLLAITLLFGHANSRWWDLPAATNALLPITASIALMPLLWERSSSPRAEPRSLQARVIADAT
jgi:Glycosyltransferase family 87